MLHALLSLSLSRMHMCGLLDTFSCLHGERPPPCGDIDLLLGYVYSHSLSLLPASSSDLRMEGDLHICLALRGLLLLVLGRFQVKRTLRCLLPRLSCPLSLPISLPGKV